MRNPKPQFSCVSGKSFTGNKQFQENIYLKPEESPEDIWFIIVHNLKSPLDLHVCV